MGTEGSRPAWWRTAAMVLVVVAGVLAVAATSPREDAHSSTATTWQLRDLHAGDVLEGAIEVRAPLDPEWRARDVQLELDAPPGLVVRAQVLDPRDEPFVAPLAAPLDEVGTFEARATGVLVGPDGGRLVGTQRCAEEACDTTAHIRLEVLATPAGGPISATLRGEHVLDAQQPGVSPAQPELRFVPPAPVDGGAPVVEVGSHELQVDRGHPLDARWVVTPAAVCAGAAVHVVVAEAPSDAWIEIVPSVRPSEVDRVIDASEVPLACTEDPSTRGFWVVLRGDAAAVDTTAEATVVVVADGTLDATTVEPEVSEVELVLPPDQGEVSAPAPAPPVDRNSVTYSHVLGPVPAAPDGTRLLVGGHEAEAASWVSLLDGPCPPRACATPVELILRETTSERDQTVTRAVQVLVLVAPA